MVTKILLIDDEELFREDFALLLRNEGYKCLTAASAEEGLETVKNEFPDIIFADIVMPGKSGIDILEDINRINSEGSIIIMTSYGTLETAIKAFRFGAIDYILKPIEFEEVLIKIERIIQHKKLLNEVKFLRKEVFENAEEFSFVGKSEPIKNVKELINKVGPTNSTVLINGESGTGKEVVAQAIHQVNDNADKPFIAINCSSLQENLLESELFGHVKGAFTGAIKDKVGFMEAAGEGTIFLDEISEIPITLQSKLLRVLEQREFYRVGGTKKFPLNARIITSTNRNLKESIKNGDFREDLFYRIAVFEIDLVPLRKRIEDIPLLIEYFIKKFNNEMKKKYISVSSDSMKAMMNYNWPGNIRELRNVIERAMILCDDKTITLNGLPSQIKGTAQIANKSKSLKTTINLYEKSYITQILKENNWNKEETARILEINSSTLYRKITELGISEEN
ncbi:MAG TPA: sigma-54-dependent Fis family transcriptional regulator [Ignavibacteria bacterium]|nr:sigma-54-dependent Fis family transcriptional regulator [Ignavibacteria bacterium]